MDFTFCPDELNQYRSGIMMYILNNSPNKIPIKLVDIVNNVLKKNAKIYNAVIPHATLALKNTYGIIFKEVPESKSGRKFICYSEVGATSLYECDEEQQVHLTLLFVVLSYIFMCGVPVYENKLEEFLRGLKIYFDRPHSYFGANVKKLITETFVKQLYLKKEKCISELSTEVRYVYTWGFRSSVEFNKKILLEKTAEILGKTPNFFFMQYKEAHGNNSEDL